MPWPTVDEFTDFLPTAWASFVSTAQKTEALDAAINRWSELTGYWPFMSNGNANEARECRARGGNLVDLNGGIVTLTSVASAVTFENPTGVARVLTQDYRPMPLDAPQRVKPWTYLGTRWNVGGETGVVVVTAEWGYCTSGNLSAAVRRAVMSLAAQDLMPQMMADLSKGGLKSLTRGDEKKEWADPSKTAEVWQGNIDSAIRGGYVRDRIV